MKKEEAAYWIALAHLPGWRNFVINKLIIKFFHEKKISIVDFFHLEENIWRQEYNLDDKLILELKQAKLELPNFAFLAESLFSQGFEIIPVTSPEYSKKLKENLKASYSPAVLYIKGNVKILEEKSIAIVGSREASEISLKFTDNIAKQACKDFKVVVSGFAKGVDRQALDSAIKYKGKSIIVLPQGIMTFGYGFKKYYKQIIDGDLLVLSTFFPKSPWKVELAMARNSIIYGLADEIYVAESSEKGGTWSGVIDGLRKGRKIYIRKPEFNEKNANNLLIQKGAVPVDFNGNELSKIYTTKNTEQLDAVREPESIYNESLEVKILSIIKGRALSAKEIINKLNINWSPNKMSKYLKKLDFIEVVKDKRRYLYKIKETNNTNPTTLFG